MILCFTADLVSLFLPDVASKIYNQFLPTKDEDPYTLYNNCRGKSCNVDNCCLTAMAGLKSCGKWLVHVVRNFCI